MLISYLILFYSLKFNLRLFLTLFLTSFFSYSFSSINVSKFVSLEDEEIINNLNVDNTCSNLKSYTQELECIKNIQLSQLDLIKGKDCRRGYINLGSKEVLNINTACCYDRARITEQALQKYGFTIRHVFLHQAPNNSYFSLLNNKGSNHAVTEVLTSKGWLGVDSNEPFLLLDSRNNPNTYKNALFNGLIYEYSDIDFYKVPIIYIIGLYSRHGTFFEPYIKFIPEINLIDFFRNFEKIGIIDRN